MVMGPLRTRDRAFLHSLGQSQTFGGIRPALRARLPPHPGVAGASGTCSWKAHAETPRPLGTRRHAWFREANIQIICKQWRGVVASWCGQVAFPHDPEGMSMPGRPLLGARGKAPCLSYRQNIDNAMR